MVYIKDNVVFKNSNCNGSDIIAYIKDNVVFKNTNCNGSDIIAYIKDNVVFKNTNCNGSDIIGTVSEAKSLFPHPDDCVATTLFVLAKMGTIETS